MQNLTELPANATTSSSNLSVIVKVCVVMPIFIAFLFFILLTLYTFASHRQFFDSSRYVLFTYMLINDTLLLFSSVALFLLAMAGVQFAIIYCAPLLFFSTATFLNTPLILSTMSLERYVAIFYPLRRPAMWRSEWIWTIIVSLWIISCILPTVDFILMRLKPNVNILSTPVLCKTTILNASPIQALFKVSLNGIFFAVVAVVILFTYIRILLETRRMRQDRTTVRKALHTVLLHGLQLLLSMMAFSQPIAELLLVQRVSLSQADMSFLYYVCFNLFPRFLSPLIYGIRDEKLKSYIRKVLPCYGARVDPHKLETK
ncbi:odorant receptor 129-1 isoform X1 [Danio rerio]|uniref:Odorant receptor n=1 Tax=Danio rerio TaxID=7955 RepID=Q2PRE6_DANRE|nr:odorant receptor 129-1 [Danio rerio]XP_005157515.1 odorant receptor, family H, subfamily 129, member 1 isoform X1 [Danio rerio]ABC43321.1 odorant receptor [Danio rerio]|eukprot:NP_001076406.1 odorant receptor, family H, subfamily 129, member 1 [Danio rerio]